MNDCRLLNQIMIYILFALNIAAVECGSASYVDAEKILPAQIHSVLINIPALTNKGYNILMKRWCCRDDFKVYKEFDEPLPYIIEFYNPSKLYREMCTAFKEDPGVTEAYCCRIAAFEIRTPDNKKATVYLRRLIDVTIQFWMILGLKTREIWTTDNPYWYYETCFLIPMPWKRRTKVDERKKRKFDISRQRRK